MRDRLYRSRRDRVIGGLAAGLARNLGVDVTWVRLGWVVLAFATQGIAILMYVVLLFVIPEEPKVAAETRPPTDSTDAAAGPAPEPDAGGARTSAGWAAAAADRPASPAGSDTASASSPLERWTGGPGSSRTAALVVGVVLVLAGAWILLRRFISIDFDLGWPVVAVVLGVILVLAALRGGGRSR